MQKPVFDATAARAVTEAAVVAAEFTQRIGRLIRQRAAEGHFVLFVELGGMYDVTLPPEARGGHCVLEGSALSAVLQASGIRQEHAAAVERFIALGYQVSAETRKHPSADALEFRPALEGWRVHWSRAGTAVPHLAALSELERLAATGQEMHDVAVQARAVADTLSVVLAAIKDAASNRRREMSMPLADLSARTVELLALRLKSLNFSVSPAESELQVAW